MNLQLVYANCCDCIIKMPFKIVQTLENETPQLSICPSQWEDGGQLRWPKKKAAKKSRTENSVPNNDWAQLACVLKRNNLKSYAAAEEELLSMLGNKELEEKNQASCKNYTIVDVKNEVEQLSSDPLSENTPIFVPLLHDLPIETEEYVTIAENTNNTADQPEILISLANIMSSQKVLSDSLNTVIVNQNKLMMTMAEFSVKLDSIFKAMNSRSASATVSKDVTNSSSNNSINLYKPIQNITQLESLEQELNNEETKKDYKQKYSIVCSPGKGFNCAYQLADVLFNREFLTTCSWSGSARGQGTKVCFKSFTNVLHLFFELVHDCDSSYTIEDNNTFFKGILRNALKRKLSKLQRTPTARNKRKRQKMSDMNANADAADDAGRNTSVQDIDINNGQAKNGKEMDVHSGVEDATALGSDIDATIVGNTNTD